MNYYYIMGHAVIINKGKHPHPHTTTPHTPTHTPLHTHQHTHPTPTHKIYTQKTVTVFNSSQYTPK